jgi:hypothetical protein
MPQQQRKMLQRQHKRHSSNATAAAITPQQQQEHDSNSTNATAAVLMPPLQHPHHSNTPNMNITTAVSTPQSQNTLALSMDEPQHIHTAILYSDM